MKLNKENPIKKLKKSKNTMLCNLEKINLQIYNQWGHKVFESSGLSEGGIALLTIGK